MELGLGTIIIAVILGIIAGVWVICEILAILRLFAEAAKQASSAKMRRAAAYEKYMNYRCAQISNEEERLQKGGNLI